MPICIFVFLFFVFCIFVFLFLFFCELGCQPALHGLGFQSGGLEAQFIFDWASSPYGLEAQFIWTGCPAFMGCKTTFL